MGRRDPGPPAGPLHADAGRGVVLARAVQGGQAGEGVGHQHDVDVGPVGNAGQTNYGAAKTGIATFTEIARRSWALRRALQRHRPGRAHPAHRRTRPGAQLAGEAAADRVRRMAPGNISPFVAYLATEDCPIAGKVFFVYGGDVQLFQPYTIVDTIDTDGRWTIEELEKAAAKWGEVSFDQGLSFG